MSWSGSSPLAAVRGGMWGFLLFAGTAWLAIAWSVLRLQPSDIARVAGPVVLFGALTEAVRALAGTRTWWLNTGMAVLFALTAVLLLVDRDSSFTTPVALLGWYLMVRGAVDVAVSMMTRETDRIWGLLMVVGVVETALGFFAASPYSRTADIAVTVLGALALVRAVADLVTALRLRETGGARRDVLDLPPERAAGVAGYSAGLSDYEKAPARTGARHRAPSRSSVSATDWTIGTGSLGRLPSPGWAAEIAAATAGETAADDETGTAGWLPAAGETETAGWPVAATETAAGETATGETATGDTAARETRAGETAAREPRAAETGAGETVIAGDADGTLGTGAATGGMTGVPGYVAGSGEATWTPAPEWTAAMDRTKAAAATPARKPASHRAGASSPAAASFHDEVLRTTADLDAMLALAGVTGAAVGAGVVHHDEDLPEVPDTPEGVETEAVRDY